MPVPHSAIGQSDRRVSQPRPRMRLLIVEDETLVAMMLEDMLIELGHDVVGPAGCVASALNCLADNAVDGALLDVNLGAGEKSYAIADALEVRSIPFVFVTGYGGAGVDARYSGIPVLQKPFAASELNAMVTRRFAAGRKIE